jgi:hypothetical protein
LLATQVVKMLHVLLTVSLFSLTCLACLSLKIVNGQLPASVIQLNKWILSLCALAGFSGLALVFMKHYSFHAPWILAALVLFPSFIGLSFYLHRWKKRYLHLPVTPSKLVVLRIGYGVLIFILLCLIHDAVMKQALF